MATVIQFRYDAILLCRLSSILDFFYVLFYLLTLTPNIWFMCTNVFQGKNRFVSKTLSLFCLLFTVLNPKMSFLTIHSLKQKYKNYFTDSGKENPYKNSHHCIINRSLTSDKLAIRNISKYILTFSTYLQTKYMTFPIVFFLLLNIMIIFMVTLEWAKRNRTYLTILG